MVASHLSEEGIYPVMYLDDWLFHSPTKEGVSASVERALRVVADMGFLVNRCTVRHKASRPIFASRKSRMNPPPSPKGSFFYNLILEVVGVALGLFKFCGSHSPSRTADAQKPHTGGEPTPVRVSP